ncbi:MAG: methionyl-tRNA formyltransferase [Lachnospiraceae bacterium]|nr:methionyl-tRNA formyltransferase [Lachnospiraceae bacterium]MDD7050794.1 methionyl-tRNA formyltransferase [Lachnospiraceae bacterium]MDY3223706.1 methionyl-tRNA formyltransferase [Lachnospiraceae bacterium]
MRIVFMGTPDFAVGALEALVEAGHQVAAVVTQPDKPKGRGGKSQITPVKACALEHGLPVFQPERIKAPEAVERLRGYQAQLFVVAAFGQILSQEILEIPQYGCINIHASLLPKYRGAAPIQWAIIEGEKETGVTLMQMDKGLDTGDMLAEARVSIETDETGGSLFDKLSRIGAKLLVDTLPAIEAGRIIPRPQNDAQSSYAGMMKKEMGLVDWNKPAAYLERLVRGLNPWPSAYTRLNGKTLKIWATAVEQENICNTPGKVVQVTRDSIKVQTGDGLLCITEVQLEGKKRMEVKAFLLGYPVEENTLLG